MRMSRTVTEVLRPPFVRRSFISVYERWLWTYLTVEFESVNNCYVGLALDDGHIDLLEVSTDRRETYKYMS